MKPDKILLIAAIAYTKVQVARDLLATHFKLPLAVTV
jgi:hypothetical protein